MIIQLNKLSPLQKKIIAGGLTLITGFISGIKFCDVKIKAQIGNYQIQIKKLESNVSERDKTIEDHISVKETKIKEALIAKQKADEYHSQANEATKRYRELVAQIPENVESSTSSNEVNPTPIQVAKACDEVIAVKDKEIELINVSLTDCFDAKTAADQAIKELQANEVDLKASGTIKDKINNDLSKQVESQNRRKWLYFVGGIITYYLADKAVQKR